MPLAVFGLFAVVVFWLLDVFAGRNSRTDERLDELRESARAGGATTARQGQKATMRCRRCWKRPRPLWPSRLQPKTEAEAGKLQAKLAQAGFRSEAAASVFLGLKFIGLMVGLFLGGGTLMIVSGANRNAMMYTVVLTALLFYLPDWSCGSSASSRQAADLSRPARRARPDGRVRRSRAWASTRPCAK